MEDNKLKRTTNCSDFPGIHHPSLNLRSMSVGSRDTQGLQGSSCPPMENRDRMIATAAILSEALLLAQNFDTNFSITSNVSSG
jgi:hypothetical protein